MVALQSAGRNTSSGDVGWEDVVVFTCLELLGTLAITGNLCLIMVLLKHKYLQRASFILMLSLAIADVLHGFVTTCHFYPPIILKMKHVPALGTRIFNVVDWTAWGITLTHMSGICLDRLIAIMLYGRYSLLVTVKRVKAFTLFCWVTFAVINTLYIVARVCCLITPLQSNQFYTFGYGEFEDEAEKQRNPFNGMNVFTFTYSPLELTTIAILSISNPITLVQLYRRHKRKVALRMASTMLLEMSMRMGSKHINNDVRELAARRANRQQQRILLQISVVAVIFYLYMSTYYLVYHVFEVTNKWVVLFNSFFYSTTHMINPVIYFSLNKEMRNQLMNVLNDVLGKVCCLKFGDDENRRKLHSSGPSVRSRSSNTKNGENSITITETSPLCPSNTNGTNGSAVCTSVTAVERFRRTEFTILQEKVQHNSSAPSLSQTNPVEVLSSNGYLKSQVQETLEDGTVSEISQSRSFSNTTTFTESGKTVVETRRLSERRRLSRQPNEEEDSLLMVNQPRRTGSLFDSIMKEARKKLAALDVFGQASYKLNSAPIRPVQSRSMELGRQDDEAHGADDSFDVSCSSSSSAATVIQASRRSCEKILRDSLVMLINEAATTVTANDATNDGVEDDIIFL